MRINSEMALLLKKYSVRVDAPTSEDGSYPIWQKTDGYGRVYWGVSFFWGLDRYPIAPDEDLSRLEWEGNEVCLDGQSEEETVAILRQALGIIAFWKRELEEKYPETPFYIFASYDNGDMMILDEGELPTRSVTLRFWADRGNNEVVNLECFDEWDRPAIVEFCNF